MTITAHRIQMPYGAGFIPVDIPAGALTMLPNTAAPADAEESILAQALDEPAGTPPLEELARGRKSAIILIACRTRRTGSHLFIPLMRERLNAAGISDDRILVYTATGTHDNWRDEDAPLLLGKAAGDLRVSGHDCRTPETLREVGITTRGNRVRLSTTYLDADLKITTGRVTYHYFAGFSAGRKGVLPGVSAIDTILYNHGMAVLRDGEIRLNPEARNGNLATNPIHLDMVEAARMAPPDFSLCTVLNSGNEVTHAYGGDMLGSHEKGVEVVRSLDSPTLPAPADLMIVSCGGDPCDVNAIQAIKAILNNYEAVRPGGAMVVLAKCPEGAAQWLVDACSIPTLPELQERIAANKVRQPHNPLWIRKAREHAHVIMVTDLADETVAAFGFHKAHNVADALALAQHLSGPPKVVVAVPYGNITVVRKP